MNPISLTFEFDNLNSITVPFLNPTLGLEIAGVIISIKDQDGNDIPINGKLITRENCLIKTNNITLTITIDNWFVLVNHVFKFDIPRGTILTNIHNKNNCWFFVYQGKEYKTYYGWALARETSENRRLAARYWKLTDAFETIKMEKDILFTNINKAESYNNDESDE